MIHRTQLLLQQHSLKIQGGTFHAMGLIWLKHYGGALGLPPKFSIMDEDDAQGLVHLLMSKLSFSRRKGFPKKQHILALFSRAVNTLRSIADTVSSDFPWLETHTPQLVVLFRAYTETKWRQHRVDYDDLLFLVYKLLSSMSLPVADSGHTIRPSLSTSTRTRPNSNPRLLGSWAATITT